MPSVSKRKRGDVWYIRFQEEGKKEVTKRLPGSLHESTIDQKVNWYKEQIALDRFDPWEEKKKKQLGLQLSEAISKYINNCLDEGRWKVDETGKSHTANTNQMRLNALLEAVGDIPVEKIDPEDVRYWLTHKEKMKRKGGKRVSTGQKISPVTMKSWKISINSFLKWLYEQGHLSDLRQVYLPKQVINKARDIIKQPSGITLNQMNRFCRAAAERSKRNKKFTDGDMMWIIPCAQLAFWVMLRHDELLHMYPEDFSEDLHYITIGKSGRFIPKSGIVTMPMLDPARKVVEQFGLHKMDKGKPIFDYSYDYLNVAFRRISKEAFDDKLFPPHSFRHGGIMHLRSVLQEPGLVTELARHSSQETTERVYGGVDPVYLKRAVDRAPLEGIEIFGK